MRQDCILAVEQAIGRALKQGEAQDIEARIIKAKRDIAVLDRKAFSQMTDLERLEAAGQKVAADLIAELAKKNQRLALDILATQKNLDFINNHPELPPLHALNRILAFYADSKGRIISIESKSRAIAADAKSQMLDLIDATKGKFLGIIDSKDMVRDIVRELHGTDTGNVTAKQAAKQFSEVTNTLRERFNRAGGEIGKLDDWGLPHSHSEFRLLQAGREAWLNTLSPVERAKAVLLNSLPNRNFSKPYWIRDAMAMLNRERYVTEDGRLMNDDEVSDLLSHAYDSITTGGANSMDPAAFKGTGKRSTRGSDERVLHFRDGDAWLDYQAKYGDKNLLETMMGHIDRAALDIAMVEQFGSNPNTMYRFLSNTAKKEELTRGDMTESQVNKLINNTDNLYNQVGRLNAPVSTTLGNWFKAYRNSNVAAKLGGTAIMTLGDEATQINTARANGIAYHAVFAQHLALINPFNADGRELARSLGVGIEEFLSSLARWGDDGLADAASRAGKAAKWSGSTANLIMKISGTNANTAAGKQGFSMMLLDKYGRLTRDKEWSDLGTHDREWLERAGVGEADWKVWQLAEPVVDGSKQMLTAQSIYQIPDGKIMTVIAPELAKMRAEVQAEIDHLDARNQKDQKWVSDRHDKYAQALIDAQAKLDQFTNNKDVRGTQERQALQDRVDLLQAHVDRAKAQADIDAYLSVEKHQNRIKTFLNDVNIGSQRGVDSAAATGEKLGAKLEASRRIVAERQKAIDKITASMEGEIKTKFVDLQRRLDELTNKLDTKNIAPEAKAERTAAYEKKLGEMLSSYAATRDTKTAGLQEALTALRELHQSRAESAQTAADAKIAAIKDGQDSKTSAAGDKVDSSVQAQSRHRGSIGEQLGETVGRTDRRIKEIQARMRQSERDQTKAVTEKTQEISNRIDKHSKELADFINRSGERQAKRQHVIDRLNKSIGQNEINMAKRAREQAAGNLMAHVLDEQGLAVIEAGVRERAKLYGSQKDGTYTGEIWKSMLQFKSFTAALMMRHGGRMQGYKGGWSKAAYGVPLFVTSTLLGGLILQLQSLASGDDPRDMTALKFWGNSMIKGGSLGVYGDIIQNGMTPTGMGVLNMLGGPIGSDVQSVFALTTGNASQLWDGKKTNAGVEATQLAKGHLPGANLWYIKAAINHMIFNQLQELANPGYNDRMTERRRKVYDTSSWWQGDNALPDRTPNMGKAVGDR